MVTELGITTLVKLEQSLNAHDSIVVTDEGIVTLVKPVQSRNALVPMRVTL